MKNICSFFHVNADQYRKYYKKQQSGFKEWGQYHHCEDFLLFPENIGQRLSIDEVSLSKGELYTFVTNKAAKGKKGSIVACISGTKSEEITKVLRRIPVKERKRVKEITLDMAANMSLASQKSFPLATQVTDRFHVIRLGLEALQSLRTKYRWQEMDEENERIKQARKKKEKYKPKLLSNQDTPKELLARSRFVLAKKQHQWTENQAERASVLFKHYPEIERAYLHVIQLRNIYENKQKLTAIEPLKKWIDQSRNMGIKQFLSVANTIENHFETILNFFNQRSTNANAESFNSKIKLFRANQRGVVDTKFFLFRLTKLFA